MAEYLIHFDDGFLIRSFRRHWALQPSRIAFKVVKACAAVLLAVGCLSSAAQGWAGMAIFWAILIVVLLMSHQVDYWLMRRRFRRSPYRGETVRLSVEPEGVHSVAGTHDARFQWSAYTRAIGLPDGIMLYQGPSVFGPSGIFVGSSVGENAAFPRRQVACSTRSSTSRFLA
jgi:hypothetical protein